MSRTGEVDVKTLLLFKNPLFWLHRGIPPLPQVPSEQSCFGYGLRTHLLWRIGSVRQGRGCRGGGRGGSCPSFVWAKPTNMPWFVAIEAQSLLHPFPSFLGGYCIDIHGVWISTLDIPSSSRFFFCLFRGFSGGSS